MSQNVNLIRRAMLEQDPNTLGQLATELFQRDPLNNDFRGAAPFGVTGVVPSTADTGDCVYLVSASGGTMTFAVCDPSDPTKMPAFGVIEHKGSSTSAWIRPFGVMGEYESSGLTAGSLYVVGSDGALAKFGGSNYPAAGSTVQNVGVALSTTKLLIVPGFGAQSSAGGDLDYINVAASSVLTNSTTETTLLSYTIPANTLRAGSRIEIDFAGITPATNSTDTFLPKLKFGSTDVLGLTAKDAANNDTFCGKITAAVRSTTSLFPMGFVQHGVVGTTHPKPISHAAVTIDATAAIVLALTGTWSVADPGNTARADVLRVRIKR